MTYEEFFNLTKDVRDTQRLYFDKKDWNVLVKSKRLEKQLDRILLNGFASLETGAQQGRLFENDEMSAS